MQVLWRHRRAIGNVRFGALGLGSLPYGAVFEGVGPLLEIAGYAILQICSWWGCVGTVQSMTGTGGGWGAITRRTFGQASAPR
jgi:hypothetical protein